MENDRKRRTKAIHIATRQDLDSLCLRNAAKEREIRKRHHRRCPGEHETVEGKVEVCSCH
jgi:hypothetical protein